MPNSKFAYKLGLLVVFVTIMLTLVTCSTSTSVPAERQPTLPATRSLDIQTDTPLFRPTTVSTTVGTLTSHPTVVPEVAPTLAVMTSSPNNVEVKVFQIESGVHNDQYPELSRCVEKAFWSEDGQIIYAFAPGYCGDKPLKWVVYDITTRSTTAISSPLKYDPSIWQRLNVPEPLSGLGLYPELQEYISPSGEHVIYTVTHGDPFTTPHPAARVEVWVANLSSHRKVKLSFDASIGIIHQASWINDETKVVFDFGYEGGVELYIADVREGTVVSLNDVSDFKGGTEQLWAMSPDGTTLAVIDLQLNLWLVSLEDGKKKFVEQLTRHPSWSKDSKSLYYWWGPSFEDTGTLRVYDITSGNISALVSQSSFTSAFDTSPLVFAGDFAVSPSGGKILLWGGSLRLVELRK